MGLTYNRFHVTAVCSPTRAAMLTGRNQHRVGFGLDRRVPGPVPGLHRVQAAEVRARAADPQGERLRHRRVRQVAPDPGQRPGRGRPLRPLAAVVGLRPLVGLPERRGRPVRPDHHAGQLDARRPGGQRTDELYYFPDDLTDKAIEWLHAVRAQDAAQAVDDVLLDRLRPRSPSRREGVGRQVQRQVRPRLGPSARGDPRAPEEARSRPAGCRADRAPRGLRRPGTR